MSYVDNSTLRTCDGPGCVEAYDAITGPTGNVEGLTWSQLPTFGLHMCPDHSAVYWKNRTGPHVPRLDNRTGECSCGHRLPGQTLGDMRRAYLSHLSGTRP